MASHAYILKVNATAPGSESLITSGSTPAGPAIFAIKTGTTSAGSINNWNNSSVPLWVIPVPLGTEQTIYIASDASTMYATGTCFVPFMAIPTIRTTSSPLSETVVRTMNIPIDTYYGNETSWEQVRNRYATSSYISKINASLTNAQNFVDINSVVGNTGKYMTNSEAASGGFSNLSFVTPSNDSSLIAGSEIYFKARSTALTYTRPATYTGYTVTVNASTVSMTVNDEVQGYGSHSMRLIQVYAVTTGGTETLILAKPGATTVSFGLNTVSLGRQTTTVNGVKRFKMTFMVNGFNGVGATEFSVGGKGSDVYDYTDGTNAVEMYTDDLTSNITISSSGTVDLILWAGY